jgi:hypothetical protein
MEISGVVGDIFDSARPREHVERMNPSEHGGELKQGAIDALRRVLSVFLYEYECPVI